MPKELLHLIDGHFSGIEQDGRDRVAQEMRINPLFNTSLSRLGLYD